MVPIDPSVLEIELMHHDDRELTTIMREVADALGGACVMLSAHPGVPAVPTVIFVDQPLRHRGSERDLLKIIHEQANVLGHGESAWASGPPRSSATLLVSPIEQAGGHCRLMLAMIFDALGEEGRKRAEILYRERRPLIGSFFRLWQTHRMLERRSLSLEMVLDQTAIGVILLQADGKIVFSNETAERFLLASDGLTRSNGSPRATHLADSVNFQAALGHISHDCAEPSDYSGSSALLTFRRRSAPPLIASLVPSSTRPVQSGDVAATLYLIDPVINATESLSPICHLFGLSPVETSLACHLAAGQSLSEAALTMRIKDQTARGYLKTVFIKTATNRQSELVALLLSSLLRVNGRMHQEVLPSATSEAALMRFL